MNQLSRSSFTLQSLSIALLVVLVGSATQGKAQQWNATGSLGADATDLDGDANANVQAKIDGAVVTTLYAGRAPGFVGLNQLNIVLPAGIASGTHTVVISRNGVVSNAVTIAIR